MVDPFTALSAAGNTLQFAELGVKIIRKTIQYADGGGSNQHQALQDVVQNLLASNAHLDGLLKGTAAELVQPGPSWALRKANDECLRLAQELVALLQRLKLNRSGTMWNSGTQNSLLHNAVVHAPFIVLLINSQPVVYPARMH